MCPSSLKARPIELNPECPRKSQTQNLGRIIILKIYVTEDSEVWVSGQFSSVVQLCPTLCNPLDCSTPGFLSITNFWSLLKGMTMESMMPSNHLILCCLFLLLPSKFPSIREIFPMNWLYASGGQNIGVSDSASVLPVNIQDWFLLGLTSLISLISKGHSEVSSKVSVLQCSAFFMVQLSHPYINK